MHLYKSTWDQEIVYVKPSSAVGLNQQLELILWHVAIGVLQNYTLSASLERPETHSRCHHLRHVLSRIVY